MSTLCADNKEQKTDMNANVEPTDTEFVSKEKSSKNTFSFTKGLTRLSFSVYLSNYLFVRTSFFIRRAPFYNDLFHLVSCSLFALNVTDICFFPFLGRKARFFDCFHIHFGLCFRLAVRFSIRANAESVDGSKSETHLKESPTKSQ